MSFQQCEQALRTHSPSKMQNLKHRSVYLWSRFWKILWEVDTVVHVFGPWSPVGGFFKPFFTFKHKRKIVLLTYSHNSRICTTFLDMKGVFNELFTTSKFVSVFHVEDCPFPWKILKDNHFPFNINIYIWLLFEEKWIFLLFLFEWIVYFYCFSSKKTIL